MACIRNLGLTSLPIVCIDVDNFYEPFREMLGRAYDDKLINKPPDEIVHFALNAEAAVRWIEAVVEQPEGVDSKETKDQEKRKTLLNRGSFYAGITPMEDDDSKTSKKNSILKVFHMESSSTIWSMLALSFTVGVTLGFTLSRSKS